MVISSFQLGRLQDGTNSGGGAVPDGTDRCLAPAERMVAGEEVSAFMPATPVKGNRGPDDVIAA